MLHRFSDSETFANISSHELIVPDLTQIEQMHVRYNPGSTQYRMGTFTVADELARLHESDLLRGIHIDARPTSPSIDGNIENLQDADEGSVVLSLGGDGTASSVLTAVHALERTVPVIIGHRGKIGDLAQQLYSKHDFDRPELLLEFGKPKPVFPVEIAVDEKYVAMSWLYTTWGTSALAAQRYYNNPRYRELHGHEGPNKNTFSDTLAAGQAIILNRGFTVQELLGARALDEGSSINTYAKARYLEELIVANGRQMGGKLKVGGNLFTDEVRINEATNKWKAIALAGALLLGRGSGSSLEDEYRFIAEGANGAPLIAQIDGEDLEFDEPTLFAVRRHERPVHVYADPTH